MSSRCGSQTVRAFVEQKRPLRDMQIPGGGPDQDVIRYETERDNWCSPQYRPLAGALRHMSGDAVELTDPRNGNALVVTDGSIHAGNERVDPDGRDEVVVWRRHEAVRP